MNGAGHDDLGRDFGCRYGDMIGMVSVEVPD